MEDQKELYENIIDFMGKLHDFRTIEAALKSNIFDKILSTDSEEIAKVGRDYIPEVPF